MRDMLEESLRKAFGNEAALIDYHSPEKTSHDVFFVDFSKNGRIDSVVYKIFPYGKVEYKNPSLRKESDVLNYLRENSNLYFPEVYLFDDTGSIFSRDYFIMERLYGIPMSKLIRESQNTSEKKKYVDTAAELIHRIHSLDTEPMDFLEDKDFALETISRIEKITDLTSEHMSEHEYRATLESIKKLRKRKPDKDDESLINGDFGADHFLKTSKGYSIIDWDPAEKGDKSWDIYWMIKDIPEMIFGYGGALDDILVSYESRLGRELMNKSFYSDAASVWAYVLGWYIETNVPDHVAVPKIKQARAGFLKKMNDME